MAPPFSAKDNEFVAWYPCALDTESAKNVWQKSESAFYVHIPFCAAICDYCGFSVAEKKSKDIDRYLEALILEIDGYKNRLIPNNFICGHIGGGTPSVLNVEQFVKLVRALRVSLDINECAEFTIEANPLSLTEEKCDAYLSEGINRLSLGIQSFNERTLKTIGRPHKSTDVLESLEIIAKKGFRNFSLDIMYGVPGTTIEDLLQDLELAVATGAPHISCFRLEIIPFTKLKLREGAGLLPPRLSRSELDHMDAAVHDFLCIRNGYRQYGVFNFAKPGYESVHNRIAFAAPQSEYVGFGNSAYSFINNHVYCNETDSRKYVDLLEAKMSPISHARKLTTLEEMGRFFVLGLKMQQVHRKSFIDRFGLEPEKVFGSELANLVANGYLTTNPETINCTPEGFKYINNVCKEFYTGENISHPQHLFTFQPTITQTQVAYFVRRRAELVKHNG